MKNKRTLNNSGFTIIEVLIVLAIAGLIILIVFLAVPALQRNSRNTQRTNDASRFVAAMQECASNRSSAWLNCLWDVNQVAQYTSLDPTTLEFKDNQQLTRLDGSAAGYNQMYVRVLQKCNSDGSDSEAGGARDAVILWHNETNSGTPAQRCMDVRL